MDPEMNRRFWEKICSNYRLFLLGGALWVTLATMVLFSLVVSPEEEATSAILLFDVVLLAIVAVMIGTALYKCRDQIRS
jgi:membrane protein DedA with SNARE-associated domain